MNLIYASTRPATIGDSVDFDAKVQIVDSTFLGYAYQLIQKGNLAILVHLLDLGSRTRWWRVASSI
jgi:hypothetical protein